MDPKNGCGNTQTRGSVSHQPQPQPQPQRRRRRRRWAQVVVVVLLLLCGMRVDDAAAYTAFVSRSGSRSGSRVTTLFARTTRTVGVGNGNGDLGTGTTRNTNFHRHTTRKDLYRLGTTSRTRSQSSLSSMLTMRDRSSSYWFSVGQRVRVVEDVWRGSSFTSPSISTSISTSPSASQRENLKGRTGTVVETWEKCDVDPTCCCAEQVDTNMAVRVEFAVADAVADADAVGVEAKTTNSTTTTTRSQSNALTKTKTPATATSTATSIGNDPETFYYYFAEDELVKL